MDKEQKPLYSLILTLKDKDYIVESGSLVSIYLFTVQAKDKTDLMIKAGQKLNIPINPRYQSVDIKIQYNKNRNKEGIRMVYAEDKKIFNEKGLNKYYIDSLFNSYQDDEAFLKAFVKRYHNSPYLASIAVDIINAIDSRENYSDDLEELLSAIKKSDKGYIDTYFFIKKYDRDKAKEEYPDLMDVDDSNDNNIEKKQHFDDLYGNLKIEPFEPEFKNATEARRHRLEELKAAVRDGNIDMDAVYAEFDSLDFDLHELYISPDAKKINDNKKEGKEK